MKLTGQVKPIEYLRDHAEEALQQLGENARPLILTQEGEAKAILLDIAEYEDLVEAISMLRILKTREDEADRGELIPHDDVMRQAKEKLRSREEVTR